MVSPTFFRSLLSWAGGWMMFMPLDLSWSMYHWFFSSLSFQPRASASAPALSRASWVGLSRALNACRFTSTAFLGSQAWVLYQFLMCSYVLESKPVDPDDI